MTEIQRLEEEIRHNQIVQELIEIRMMQIRIMQKITEHCDCKGNRKGDENEAE